MSALDDARRLAVALHEKHFRDPAVDWQPLPDLRGLISQIDNMTAGMARTEAPAIAVVALQAIAALGRSMPGHGYSCATIAIEALERIGTPRVRECLKSLSAERC